MADESTERLPPDYPASIHWYAEAKRHTGAFVDIIKKWPEYRSHIAYALLGEAVATCDVFGLDVEGFIAKLRRQQPLPAVLVPPKEHGS